MKRMLRLFIALSLTAPVWSGDNSGKPAELDPKEILKRTRAAVKEAKVVTYRADYTAEGWVAQFVPKVQGSVVVGDDTQQGVERFSCQVKITPADATEPIEFSAGSDGDQYYLIDNKTKTVHQDLDPAVLGSHGRNLRRAVMTEFGSREPFREELAASTVELRGAAKIGEEECYEVYVNPGRPPELVWWISKKDFLPRQLRRLHKNPEGKEGMTQLTVLELKVDPKHVDDSFAAPSPEGYKKTDEFAP